MKSMTGYGYAECQNEKLHISLEIKSYNNRYLDIIINLPPFLNQLEQELRKAVSENAERGRVEIYLRVRELEEDIEVNLDRAAVSAYAETLREMAEAAGVKSEIELGHLLAVDGLMKVEKKRDIDAYRSLVMPLFEDCRSRWEQSRIKEGLSAEKDISRHISMIKEAVCLFELKADEMEDNIKNNIRTKFRDVLGDELDEQRILAETAVLLVKYSINEEIVRLNGHLDTFLDEISSGEAVGKKLDFICQEINREINTIGSKSFIMEINQKVVEVKDKLENVREQLRNVE